MTDAAPVPHPKSSSQPNLQDTKTIPPTTSAESSSAFLDESATIGLEPSSTPDKLSRNVSFSGSSFDEDDSSFPPLNRLTVLDLLENLALSTKLEQLQNNVNESVKRQQQRLRSGGKSAREKVAEEWRRRVPTPDEQIDKYRQRMRQSVDKIGKQWNDRKNVTVREKMSFMAGVFNIFISGYLMGCHPEKFHWWYAAQLAYFMPIRWYTYHKKGYHYFLADLCYFTNFLLVLSIWVFPQSKRLLISTFCLAFGNNAIAIAMWRNMLVFHSLDKVTSLFVHIMPCVTLHCFVHLVPLEFQESRYPAVYRIKTAPPGAPHHYTPLEMLLWSSIPYAMWQINYYFFITYRRADKIAAGRQTSFVWLKRSYKDTWLGHLVHSLPEQLQEFAFMAIQYGYAMLTTIPCALWFWYRWLSAAFLITMFGWSVYRGATYYIEIFGRRFENELEQLKRDVAKWQTGPEGMKTPLLEPENGSKEMKSVQNCSNSVHKGSKNSGSENCTSVTEEKRKNSTDGIPLLDEEAKDISS